MNYETLKAHQFPYQRPQTSYMSTEEVVTDHRSLDKSLITGMAWTAMARWGAQLVSWIATIYAARKLTPGDYGLVAMGTLPIGLARMVEDFGLDSVLLQNRTINAMQQARLAGFVLIIGVICTALFTTVSYPVAQFFNEPNVALIICALSPLFIADALQIVPKAGLQRNLQFRRLAMVGLTQSACTSLALVVCTALHLGYWALVFNSLAGSIAATLLLFWWHPYAIAWPRQMATLTIHIKQGWRVLMTRATWYAYSSADQAIIGKLLGKESLGAYSFATTFANLPIQEVTSTVSRVVPGVFTRVQDRQSELRRYFLVLNEFISYLAFPAAMGIALTADVAMSVILGPQWGAVIAPLRILCIYSAFYAAQTLISHVLTWTGQFRAVMWCSALTAAVLPVGLLAAAHYGLPAIAWAWAILFPLTNIPPIILAFRTLGISFGNWMNSMRPAIIACISMAATVLATQAFLPENLSHQIQFIVQVAVGAATYAGVLWFGFRARVMAIIDTVKSARS